MADERESHLQAEIAKVLFEAERQLLFDAAGKLSLDCDEVRRFLISLSNESDRALAIVAAAYIDAKLKQWLAAVFNPHVTGGVDALFQGFGPLDSFSSRIRMASALNWISKPTEASLDGLRRIRNEFAHRPFISGFDDSRIAAHLSAMPELERGLLDELTKRGELPRPLAPREVFHLRVGTIIMYTVSEIATAPLATRRSLHPFTVAHAPHNELPESLQELSLAVAGAVLALLQAVNSSSSGSATAKDGA